MFEGIQTGSNVKWSISCKYFNEPKIWDSPRFITIEPTQITEKEVPKIAMKIWAYFLIWSYCLSVDIAPKVFEITMSYYTLKPYLEAKYFTSKNLTLIR